MVQTAESCIHGPPPPEDLEVWETVWSKRPAFSLLRSWDPQPHPRFRPAEVRTGWSDRAWHVLAVIEDDDIFNSARGARDKSWETGDVFEIFLQPWGQPSYFEIQITPENHGLRLRFPGIEFVRHMARFSERGGPWIFDHLHRPPGLITKTRIQPEHNRWLVGANLPFADFLENGHTTGPLQPWQVSFCRYDYTRGEDLPVLSSTSRFPRASFHMPEHWNAQHFTRP